MLATVRAVAQQGGSNAVKLRPITVISTEGTTARTDVCSCNICIHHIPVVYAGGRLPKVGTIGEGHKEQFAENSESHKIPQSRCSFGMTLAVLAGFT
ncbi:hypothetical protein MCAMS1_02353 [biofilm metagenome]